MIDHSLSNFFCSYTLAKIATFPITFLPVKEFSLHYFVVLHICKYLATSYSTNQIHFVLVSLNRLWQTRDLDHAKSSSSGGGTYFLLLSLKKFLNPFCFAFTLGLLPHLKAKWQNIAGSKKFFTWNHQILLQTPLLK